MRTDELDFDLPPELIAQTPAEDRAASRLLHYRRSDRSIEHRQFSDLPALLRPGDLLVFNDTRVIPARFLLQKPTGGLIEGLFLDEPHPGRWHVLLRGLGKYAGPLHFAAAPEVAVHVARRGEGGEYEIRVQGSDNNLNPEPCAPNPPVSAVELLARIGRMPLPPYIKRDRGHDDRDDLDRQRYQTVYARPPQAEGAMGRSGPDAGSPIRAFAHSPIRQAEGHSVAAPTAGLHFTPQLLQEQLDQAGIQRTFVTLHVGMGTFKPVTAASLEEHRMHTEEYEISPHAADLLNRAKAEGRRIIAVGTTAARVLESQGGNAKVRMQNAEDRRQKTEGIPTTDSCLLTPVYSSPAFVSKRDQTNIFIHPRYSWKHVDALITNFHLPRSTLIALVAALVGLDEQRRIYRLAIDHRYRFFSYGDAMFIE